MKNTSYFFINFGLLLLSAGCTHSQEGTTEKEFRSLMQNVAIGWSTQNTELALSSFDGDAIYMEPPNIQYYRGHSQLRPYFDELDDTYKMEFHNLWFNQDSQSGVGEYTFSYGKDTSDVGVVVVELKNGKIAFWREYQQKGPTDFNDFLSTENKEWEWHIGNYPAPKDSLDQN